MEETTPYVEAMADTGPHPQENTSASSSIATQVVVRMSAHRDEHTCVNFVWNPIAQWSVLATQGGGHPKVRGSESTRASGEFGCFLGVPRPTCQATARHRCGVSEGGFEIF